MEHICIHYTEKYEKGIVYCVFEIIPLSDNNNCLYAGLKQKYVNKIVTVSLQKYSEK